MLLQALLSKLVAKLMYMPPCSKIVAIVVKKLALNFG